MHTCVLACARTQDKLVRTHPHIHATHLPHNKNTFPCCFCGVQDVPFKGSTPLGCQSLRSLSPSISRNSGNVSIKKAKNTVLGGLIESNRNDATAAQRWARQRRARSSPHAHADLGLKAWHRFSCIARGIGYSKRGSHGKPELPPEKTCLSPSSPELP